MKETLCILVLLLIQGSLVSQDSELQVRATINGIPILASEVEESLRLSKFLFGDNGFDENRGLIEDIALETMIERKLIILEFKKLGGQIQSEYVEKSMKDFTASRFAGDCTKLKAELSESQIPISIFRKHLEEDMIIRALRSEHEQKGDLDSWLSGLRDNAAISIRE